MATAEVSPNSGTSTGTGTGTGWEGDSLGTTLQAEKEANDNSIVLDRSEGQRLDMQLEKTATGKGAIVKSVDPGGQCEEFSWIVPGLTIKSINGQDISDMIMKEIGKLIRAKDECEMTFEDKNHKPQNTILLDRSGGKKLGIKMAKGFNDKGAKVKSIDAGSQAEKYPGIFPELRITHINGTVIGNMDMKEIGGIIKSQDQCEVTFEERYQNTKNTIVLDRSMGKKLGIKLLTGDNDKGAVVKSVDVGGQCEQFPGIKAGLKITHINYEDISEVGMPYIGGVIRGDSTCRVTFESNPYATLGLVKDDPGHTQHEKKEGASTSPTPTPLMPAPPQDKYATMKRNGLVQLTRTRGIQISRDEQRDEVKLRSLLRKFDEDMAAKGGDAGMYRRYEKRGESLLHKMCKARGIYSKGLNKGEATALLVEQDVELLGPYKDLDDAAMVAKCADLNVTLGDGDGRDEMTGKLLDLQIEIKKVHTKREKREEEYRRDLQECEMRGTMVADALAKAGDKAENSAVWNKWEVEIEKTNTRPASMAPNTQELHARITKAPAVVPVTTQLKNHLFTEARERRADKCPDCDIALPFVPCPHGKQKSTRLKFVDDSNLFKTIHNQGFAVPFLATRDYMEHEGEPGFLSFKAGTTIFVWNETGKDEPLEKEDKDGNLWLDGWIGHGSAKGIKYNDEGFGEGVKGFAQGIFPLSMVGPPAVDDDFVDNGLDLDESDHDDSEDLDFTTPSPPQSPDSGGNLGASSGSTHGVGQSTTLHSSMLQGATTDSSSTDTVADKTGRPLVVDLGSEHLEASATDFNIDLFDASADCETDLDAQVGEAFRPIVNDNNSHDGLDGSSSESSSEDSDDSVDEMDL